MQNLCRDSLDYSTLKETEALRVDRPVNVNSNRFWRNGVFHSVSTHGNFVRSEVTRFSSSLGRPT
jgi:hypothetical protein